jgi:hypothetical protein
VTNPNCPIGGASGLSPDWRMTRSMGRESPPVSNLVQGPVGCISTLMPLGRNCTQLAHFQS